MFSKLLFSFTLVTVLELAILIPLGNLMGFWPTLALILITGAVGAALAKKEGLRVLVTLQHRLVKGESPTNELMDGLFVLVAGTMLLTPGLLTDLTGFVFLIPAAREPIKRAVKKQLEARMKSGGFTTAPGAAGFSFYSAATGSGATYEGTSAGRAGEGAKPTSTSAPRPRPALEHTIDLSGAGSFKDGDVIDITPS